MMNNPSQEYGVLAQEPLRLKKTIDEPFSTKNVHTRYVAALFSLLEERFDRSTIEQLQQEIYDTALSTKAKTALSFESFVEKLTDEKTFICGALYSLLRFRALRMLRTKDAHFQFEDYIQRYIVSPKGKFEDASIKIIRAFDAHSGVKLLPYGVREFTDVFREKPDTSARKDMRGEMKAEILSSKNAGFTVRFTFEYAKHYLDHLRKHYANDAKRIIAMDALHSYCTFRLWPMIFTPDIDCAGTVLECTPATTCKNTRFEVVITFPLNEATLVRRMGTFLHKLKK